MTQDLAGNAYSWEQLELRFTWPEQTVYELIRPVVLFGQTAAERSRQTGRPARTIRQQVQRFNEQGLRSFCPDQPPTPWQWLPKGQLPDHIKEYLVRLRAEYSKLSVGEIGRICQLCFGRKPDDKTIRKLLNTFPMPVLTTRRFAFYSEMASPGAGRMAIVTLFDEGWSVKSIAGYLRVSRPTVYATLKRRAEAEAEAQTGSAIQNMAKVLADKSHARKDGLRKVNLRTIRAVHTLSQNPLLGKYRVSAALMQQGIELSPASCGLLLRRLRQTQPVSTDQNLQSLNNTNNKIKKEFPYHSQRRHQYWSVDVRYIEKHKLGEKPFYVISILENYSRAILASAVSRSQDEKAWLAVLYEAIRVHGIPEVLVSDSGSIFLANRSKQIYEKLGIRKEQIQRRQAWQNLIETQWNVQRRMADYHFGRAADWEAVLAVHRNWWLDFNYQEHWAHKGQAPHRRSPAAVLGWVRGKLCEQARLEEIFYGSSHQRKFSCAGYVRFRNWKVYGELGLARSLGQVRLLGEKLSVEFNKQTLAEYSFEYAPDKQSLTKLSCSQLYDTIYRSPQLNLWSEQQIKWYKVLQCARITHRPNKKSQNLYQQLTFFEIYDVAS